MLGLRKFEGIRFERFFRLVQKEAAKQNCVFFLDCPIGFENHLETMDCCNLCGWLIPKAQVLKFMPLHLLKSERLHDYCHLHIFVYVTLASDRAVSIRIEDPLEVNEQP